MKHQYSKQYRAYYDADTMRWLQDKCSDPDCEYCKDRPEYPPPESVKSPPTETE